MSLYMETTQIEAHKTIGQIQGVLASCGATAIIIEYEDKEASAISFQVEVGGQQVPFRLPCRWSAIYSILRSKRVRVKRPEELILQSKRVAWRQILKWVQAQMALVETEMVSVEEVFLPYIQVDKEGKTLFETMAEKGFKALPKPKE